MRFIALSFLFFILGLSISSCTTTPTNDALDPSWAPPKHSDYNLAVRKNTFRKQEYSGFYNQFDLSVTYLNENIRVKQLKLEANFAQWNQDKANKKNAALQDSLEQQAQFFVSIFTPKNDDSKLDIASSGWIATMYFDGQKYRGEFRPTSKDNRQLRMFYPHHTIWSRAFFLTFPVPVREINQKPFSIKFSNPYGEAIFKYNQ